jgi:hypothetical protein
MMRWFVPAALIVFANTVSYATSCGIHGPCASIRPDSILFTGTVLGIEELGLGENMTLTRPRVAVTGIFAGLAEGTEEVVLLDGGWTIAGREYLVDAHRHEDTVKASSWGMNCASVRPL